jgi:FAD:protein FMN transferase
MEVFQSTFTAMGGENLLVVAASKATQAQDAMTAAAQEVIRIQDKYSRYRFEETSIIYQINRRAGTGEWTACDPETMGLFGLAGRFYDESDGLFDITSGVLRRIWDFKTQIIPSQTDIDATLKLIGWPKVEFDGNNVRLALPGMEIDFGGFGKEYAADCAGDVLRKVGTTNGFVNLGGDIQAVGPMLDGEGWPIGVENPLKYGDIAAKITLSYGGLATSGDSRKFFIKEGRRFSHILNPITGMPVNCWSSVSVVGASTLRAGFYSTTAMLMEQSAGGFLNKKKCNFLLMDHDGNQHLGNILK